MSRFKIMSGDMVLNQTENTDKHGIKINAVASIYSGKTRKTIKKKFIEIQSNLFEDLKTAESEYDRLLDEFLNQVAE